MKDTKFKYGDSIEVISGFHRERVGTITAFNKGKYCIHFNTFDSVWIGEKHLKLYRFDLLAPLKNLLE
jgi:transcription elongation factor